MRALTPLGAMDEAHAELKAYKRKAKAQRDNWKARVVKAERELADARILLSELIDRIKGGAK
jgi:phosphoenolpyruvate-protein kinase (PTS system EI component)